MLTDIFRSPDIETHEDHDHRGSIGGWGLGNPHEEHTTRRHLIEDEDEEMGLDQAYDAPERMDEMKSNENGYVERRV